MNYEMRGTARPVLQLVFAINNPYPDADCDT